MTDQRFIEGMERLGNMFRTLGLPLRYRLPLPWPEFNREARRYAANKRKQSVERAWLAAGRDFERFTEGRP